MSIWNISQIQLAICSSNIEKYALGTAVFSSEWFWKLLGVGCSGVLSNALFSEYSDDEEHSNSINNIKTVLIKNYSVSHHLSS